jgi:hypothetical protein
MSITPPIRETNSMRQVAIAFLIFAVVLILAMIPRGFL